MIRIGVILTDNLAILELRSLSQKYHFLSLIAIEQVITMVIVLNIITTTIFICNCGIIFAK